MLFDNEYATEDDLKCNGIFSVGTNVRVARSCTIVGLKNISIGNNVRIDSFCIIIAMGERSFSIGSHVHIGGQSYLNGSYGMIIEDFANISQGCRLYSGSDDYSGEYLTNPTIVPQLTNVMKGVVRLEKHVIVGSGSVILPSVTIGEGAAVGALTLVKNSLAPWGIYCGCPAEWVRERSRRLLTLESEGLRNGVLNCTLDENLR